MCSASDEDGVIELSDEDSIKRNWPTGAATANALETDEDTLT